jgi:hypothetical protein
VLLVTGHSWCGLVAFNVVSMEARLSEFRDEKRPDDARFFGKDGVKLQE